MVIKTMRFKKSVSELFTLFKKGMGHKKYVLSCIGILFVFIFVFLGGVFNTYTNIERLGHYGTNIVSHTENKQYASLIVEETSKEHKLYSTQQEFLQMYGMFGGWGASYVGAVNADKQHDVRIKGLETDNLSFIYVTTSGFRNVEYDGQWKHEYYPLQLMFYGKNSSDGDYSFCYLSETQANKMLESRGIEKTLENYESLLGERIVLQMDEEEHTWRIANIYLEKNYFYEAVHDVLGDFLFGYNKYPESFNKQSVYFLNKSAYQNTEYINHVCSKYNAKYYSIKFGRNNIKDSFVVDDSLITKELFKNTNPISVFLFALSGLIFSVILYILFDDPMIKNPFFFLSLFLFSFLPFCLFFLLFNITRNISLFSTVSTVVNICYIIILTIYVFVVLIYGRRKRVFIKA